MLFTKNALGISNEYATRISFKLKIYNFDPLGNFGHLGPLKILFCWHAYGFDGVPHICKKMSCKHKHNFALILKAIVLVCLYNTNG